MSLIFFRLVYVKVTASDNSKMYLVGESLLATENEMDDKAEKAYPVEPEDD